MLVDRPGTQLDHRSQLSHGFAANIDVCFAVVLADTSLGWVRKDHGSRSATDIARLALETFGDAPEPSAANGVGRNGFPTGVLKEPPSTSLYGITGVHGVSPSLVNESGGVAAAREWESDVEDEGERDVKSPSTSSDTRSSQPSSESD
jgi:hypothetical protein